MHHACFFRRPVGDAECAGEDGASNRAGLTPIWWEVRPVLILDQTDWPAADGSSGITSSKAMDDAEAAGRLKLDQTSSSSSVPTCHRTGVTKHKMARRRLQFRTPALPDFPPHTVAPTIRAVREDLSAPTDGNEKATLVPKSPNPSKLCQPALKTPVVCSGSEQLL
jgi:hypothetical protein